MIKGIFKNALDNLKKNWAIIACLCLMLALVGALVFSVDLLYFGLGLLICLPFVLMPMFFAIQVAIYGLRRSSNPSWRLFFRFFASYFKKSFRGCFRYIFTFFCTAFVFIFFYYIFVTVSENVCINIYGYDHFVEIYNELYTALYYDFDLVTMYELLATSEMMTLFYVAILPAAGIAAVFFFTMLSLNSFYVYFKIDHTKYNPQYAKMVFRVGKRESNGGIWKAFFALNWPMYIFIIGGFCGGACLGYYLGYNFLNGISLALIVMMGAMFLYLPFYFSINESIFIANKDSFAKAPDITKKMVINSLQNQINIMNANINSMQNQDDKPTSEDIIDNDESAFNTNNTNNNNTDDNNNDNNTTN